MSLGIQRGLSSSLNPAASERRATELRGTDVAKATDEAKAAPVTQPAAEPAAVGTPKASDETVQGARARALGVEDQLRGRLNEGWTEAHHRKGHVRTLGRG
jgi:hypothetical protein